MFPGDIIFNGSERDLLLAFRLVDGSSAESQSEALASAAAEFGGMTELAADYLSAYVRGLFEQRPPSSGVVGFQLSFSYFSVLISKRIYRTFIRALPGIRSQTQSAGARPLRVARRAAKAPDFQQTSRYVYYAVI